MKKAVVISGAGSGIGSAVTDLFAKQGYFTILLGRTATKLERTLKTTQAQGQALVCDLSDTESVQETLAKIMELKDVSIEALVNNAGIYAPKAFSETTDEDWISEFNTNLFGSVRLTRGLWNVFVNNKRGSIVNISSTLGLKPVGGTSVYSASKAAMVNWTQTLALEGGPYRIRCNCVCPGIVDTPIHAFHSLPEEQKMQALQKMQSLQPLQRIGTPMEVAEAIFFLASEKSAWTTGAVLTVDGGINLQ